MKLVNCKKCKGEIARNEQACSHCGEKKSGILKSETSIGIAIFVLSCSFANSYDKKTASTDEIHFPYKKMHGLVTGSFYNCLSQKFYTKPGKLKLDEIFECDNDFRKDPHMPHDLINLDNFVSNFSCEDNSYRPLEKAIKSNMFDVSSYQHVETTYRLVLNQRRPYSIVQTVFKGKSAFERILKDSRAAKVDIKTGEIIELIPNVTVLDTGGIVMEVVPE
ncbi:hypothetical protein [Xenorhabdus japonica]|uniref:Uncharacterized protein n=1 Tax=Xenorhabdus japonica TaxID=53341 RepID=A0A1I5EAP1_9GAMM|nr:hypothetical protein [Xenorhabdus japonica]SFO08698.1 hypothetical protein SAMN05421579_1611 [Xenorhabdus japonica]